MNLNAINTTSTFQVNSQNGTQQNQPGQSKNAGTAPATGNSSTQDTVTISSIAQAALQELQESPTQEATETPLQAIQEPNEANNRAQPQTQQQQSINIRV